MKRTILILVALAFAIAGLAVTRGWQSQAQASLSSTNFPSLATNSERPGGQSAAINLAGVGGYTEEVADLAFAVESSGRIHALWTGKLNPYFDYFAFYSTSTDGVNWTPYQILNYYGASGPQVAVDDTRHRAHLVYDSEDGIIHHTVANGVVSAPTVLDNNSPFVGQPSLAVDASTGYVHAVWQEGYLYRVNSKPTEWRRRMWYAFWNGSAWSSRITLVNSQDTSNAAVAAAPGRVMIGWFQDWAWAQSQGGPTSPPAATIPRTAYAANGVNFRLRQGVATSYVVPETDSSFLMAYSPSDSKFYMLTNHFMWPGHSVVYRYVWNGAWTGPVEISQPSSSGWAVPLYLGAAPGVSTYYVWSQNGIKARTDTNGTLGAVQDISQWLATRGYSSSVLRFFLDTTGKVHFALYGAKDGVPGIYYDVRQTASSE